MTLCQFGAYIELVRYRPCLYSSAVSLPLRDGAQTCGGRYQSRMKPSAKSYEQEFANHTEGSGNVKRFDSNLGKHPHLGT